MYQPTYWVHGNIKFPEQEVNQVVSELKRLGSELLVRGYPASSFHFKLFSRPDKIWAERYTEIVSDITKAINLHSSTKYFFEYWSQLYTNNIQHIRHHHFDANDGNPQISFVHFIKPDKEKSFRFVTNEQEDWTPPEQNEGDLICFPSWCWHRVVPVKTKERLVVAGNIDIAHIDVYEN